jgi:hypothetical protein
MTTKQITLKRNFVVTYYESQMYIFTIYIVTKSFHLTVVASIKKVLAILL